MKPDLRGAKRQLYKAAIKMLGVSDDSDKLSNEWIDENIMAKDNTSSDHLLAFRHFLVNNVIKSRRFMYLVRYTKPKTARALMQNRKIVRYVLSRIGDIQDVHIHGSQIDKYYLNLPKVNEKEKDKDRKIDALADYLVNFSFDTLLKNKKGIIANTKCLPAEKNIEIEHLKALTGLYLSVAYIAVKNIVKTNARYYIAFSVFDRDHSILAKKLGLDSKTNKTFFQTFTYKDKDGKEKDGVNPNYFSITEYFLDEEEKNDYKWDNNKSVEENKYLCRKHLDDKRKKEHIHRHFTRKWRDILRDGWYKDEKGDYLPRNGSDIKILDLLPGNITEAKNVHPEGLLLKDARNNAEHLNVLFALPKYVGDFRKNNQVEMQSYFELYHYLLQRLMIEPEHFEKKYEGKKVELTKYADKIKSHHTPCKDLIWITNVSLAYNLARYKNLSCEALFDKDSESGKKLTAEWKRSEDEKNNKRNN
jgi:hypothetical protein